MDIVKLFFSVFWVNYVFFHTLLNIEKIMFSVVPYCTLLIYATVQNYETDSTVHWKPVFDCLVVALYEHFDIVCFRHHTEAGWIISGIGALTTCSVLGTWSEWTLNVNCGLRYWFLLRNPACFFIIDWILIFTLKPYLRLHYFKDSHRVFEWLVHGLDLRRLQDYIRKWEGFYWSIWTRMIHCLDLQQWRGCISGWQGVYCFEVV